MKKLVAIVLSVVLLFSVLPLNVFAMDLNNIASISFADTYVYDGTQDGDGKFTNYGVKLITSYENGESREEPFSFTGHYSYDSGYGYQVADGEVFIYDNQDEISWEVGNIYPITAVYNGDTYTFHIEVRENPIVEISIDDFNVVKSNDCFSEEYGEIYKIHNLLGYIRPYYVTYIDGSNSSLCGPFPTGEYSSVDLLTTCATPYEEWQSGNIYEVTASLLGKSCTFNVTVLEIDNIEVEDVECIENYDGNMDGYWDINDNYVENAWFCYNIYPNNVTVNFTNGDFISGNTSEIAEFVGSYTNCYSNQSYDNQWGLGNHTATISVCGVEKDYNVKVVETPIQDIIVDDMAFFVGTHGWKSHDPDHDWYEYDIRPEILTVILKDETVISGTYNEVCEELGYYGDCRSDQSYENLWGVGAHTATINLMGFVKEYNIIITESPISSIQIDDIEILEYTNGWYEEETYIYYDFSPKFSVTFSDGSVQSGLYDGINIGGEYYSLEIQDYTDQYNSPWVVGNAYQITGSLFGVSDVFNVTIKKSPIESLSISNIEIKEKSTGWEEDGTFYYYNFYPAFTVTLADGSVLSSSDGSSIEIDGEFYSLYIDESVQYDEPWVVGNTYDVKGSILGISDTFNVTITENPIESIVIDDIDVIVNTNGYYDSEYDCYIYSPMPSSFTAILKDGSQVASVDGMIEVDGERYGISSYNTNYWSQTENPWTVGNSYQMSANVGGFSDTFNVNIVESPVDSIEVKDIVCMEGTRGHYIVDEFGGYYRYDDIFLWPDFTVKLKDGTQLESEWYDEPGGMGNHGVLINGELYDIRNIIDNQDEEHWGVGVHTATAEFLGATDEFNITITESPVESVEIEDITLFNGIDSYHSGGQDYYYIEPTYTVTFKDGTKKTSKSDISLDGDVASYLEVHYDQWETPLEIGETYEILGSFGLVTDTFKVTIAENPIESIEVIKQPTKTEYLVGEYYDLNGMSLRINYKDSTFEDITVDKLCNGDVDNYRTYYLNHIQKNAYIDIPYGCFNRIGNNSIEIKLFGKTCNLNVLVKENPIESISIKEDVDKGIIITVNNTDSTSYDMKLLDIAYYWSDESVIHTPIITDKGIFDATIYVDVNSFSIGIYDATFDNYIKSNTLPGSEWYNLAKLIREELTYPLLMMIYDVEHFNGKITTDNIDVIIEAAGYINNLWYDANEIISETSEGTVYSGESIRRELSKYFEINNIDLSLSENYDSLSDTYTFPPADGFGGYGFERPFALAYTDGVWNVQMSIFEESREMEFTTVYLKINDNHKIVSYDVNYPYISQLNIIVPKPIIGEEISVNYRPVIETAPSENAENVQMLCSWLVSNDGVNYTLCNAGDKFENGKYYALYNGAGTVNGTDKDTVWLCNDMVYTTTSILWEGEATDVIFTTGKLIDYICGDLDGDNEVTDWDGVLLARYLAGWNVEITTLDVLDIDGDGEITDWDGVVLDRYLAGWNVSIG